MERNLNTEPGEVRMVHCGGQLEAISAAATRARGHLRAHAPARALAPVLVALAVVTTVTTPAPAAAQAAIGFHAGAAIDPEQVVGGVFFQTGDIGRGIRLRPGIDGATGDGVRIATIGLDFIYGYPLGANGWTLLAGGGPAVVITRWPDYDLRETGVGFHSMFGFGHDSGFFTEVRLGSGRAQQLKVAVGWAITLN